MDTIHPDDLIRLVRENAEFPVFSLFSVIGYSGIQIAV